jgi:hypothetical protein
MDNNTENHVDVARSLHPRQTSNSMVSMATKFGLRTLAWVGVNMLWHFDFSITWMIAPLFLRLMRDHWRKRIKKKAAREAALSNGQAMVEARMIVEDLPFMVFNPDKDGED